MWQFWIIASGITSVDICPVLKQHTEENIYCRTDHHWQPLGAYYAAKTFAEAAVGKDKLLTIATAATGRYYDFRAIEPYVDYVNIMAYDMEEAPFHHAALHCSDMTEEWSCEKAVAGHIAGGFPVQRLVLGIPFYGHGTNEAPESLDYRHIISIDSLYSRWDSVAQVPYLVNSKGTVVVNYENAQSIELKCRFLHRQGMLGAMYWDYDSDDEMGTLRHAVYRGVMQLP